MLPGQEANGHKLGNIQFHDKIKKKIPINLSSSAVGTI